MKKKSIFIGILLIAAGLFFLIPQWGIPYKTHIFTGPSILIIIGLAFLFQSYIGNETYTLYSGWVMFGLGSHFHAVQFISGWPNHWTVYTAIVGFSFLFHYSKTRREGLLFGIIFIFLSLIGYFYSHFIHTFRSIFHIIESFWPIVLVIIGIYLIFKRK